MLLQRDGNLETSNLDELGVLDIVKAVVASDLVYF